MRLPFAEPDPAGSERARKAKAMRDLATEVSRLNPQALTRTNGEEADHGPTYPANFTKGLAHDDFGLLKKPEDYRCFVEAINSPDPTLFEKDVETAESRNTKYRCKIGKTSPSWRGWESPRAGHVYELEGPDAGAVGMAPAPRVGSSELAVEMAEVYGLALLRDVPFTDIVDGTGSSPCNGGSKLTAAEITDLIACMPFFTGTNRKSSTPLQSKNGLNRFEERRLEARLISSGSLTPANVFRGSTPGAHAGPYVSQFMLIGSPSLAGLRPSSSAFSFDGARFGLADGLIRYGSLVVDQRTLTHKRCLDYMTDWCSWLDVQNGADIGSIAEFEAKRRFITTPRDLATYVHYDALYEAYLNACLLMLSLDVPTSKGFPEKSPSGHRTAFATFGPPHILSLVCEVATRCLKAVRRQKFNYHRRCRPEAIGGRLALVASGHGNKLGCAADSFSSTHDEIPEDLRNAIAAYNKGHAGSSKLSCTGSAPGGKKFKNLLLPMAFPEGSPMHPAYGAGHATVAGGCVTMLKAFFEMFSDCDSRVERPLEHNGTSFSFVPKADGSALVPANHKLTVQGELDKLAANISIGRNMAGVHYYSDYYDSLRMGERITVGILMEQAPTYGDAMETTFTSFDGDHITISGEAGSCPSLSILDRCGNPVSPRDWWLRHVSGEELNEDL